MEQTNQEAAPAEPKPVKDYTLNQPKGQMKYIRLISSDEHEFIIKAEIALQSPTIRNMLNGPAGTETDTVWLREIPSHILQTICHYLQYKDRYTNSSELIPEFNVKGSHAIELLLASNFLDI